MRTFDEFDEAVRTLTASLCDGYDPQTLASINYCAVGAAGEVGEVLDVLKKVLRRGEASQPDFRAEMALEASDALYYLSWLAGELGCSLAELAQMQVDKLKHKRRDEEPPRLLPQEPSLREVQDLQEEQRS